MSKSTTPSNAKRQSPNEMPTERELKANDRRLSGSVKYSSGVVAAKMVVRAYDRDLRSEELLGDATTDKDGRYKIDYAAHVGSKQEFGTVDLVVRVFDAKDEVLAESAIRFNAGDRTTIDLVIDAEVHRESSLFERIGATLQPVLKGLSVSELEENAKNQDITFLAGESGFSFAELVDYGMAHRMGTRALPAEFWFALRHLRAMAEEGADMKERVEAFQNLLRTFSAEDLRSGLEKAFVGNVIPVELRKRAKAWLEAFESFVLDQRIKQRSPDDVAVLALHDAGIASAPKRRKVLAQLQAHGGLTVELLADLRKQKALSTKELADVGTIYKLYELTGQNARVAGALKSTHRLRAPERIRDLAKKSPNEWRAWVKTNAKAGRIAIPFATDAEARLAKLPAEDLFASEMERTFREAFPTAAFTGGLERAPRAGSTKAFGDPGKLAGFLHSHEDFDLLRSPVDEYFTKHVPPRDALAKDAAFRTRLKAVQRVFKLAPTHAATEALLADNLHSAQMIYRMGESAFVKRYTKDRKVLGTEEARRAWRRASDTHAAVVTTIADLRGMDGEGLPRAMFSDNAALERFPNWNNLFQGGDLCACDHCRSVLSPAAYFADLLMFLKDRRAKDGLRSVKDILFERRPDLGFLDLNCENALTPIPYVDVVCEVLEAAIAQGAGDVELTGFTTLTLETGTDRPTATGRTAVLGALSGASLITGPEPTISIIDMASPDRWVVHGEEASYLLKKRTGPNFFAERLRNTKVSAEELRAYPQFVNERVYETLRGSVFPGTLPFDLFAEEVRISLLKAQVKRWELMQVLQGPNAPNNATDLEIAAEYFGIGVDAGQAEDELRLIIRPALAAADLPMQQARWGESGNANWIVDLSNVKVLLGKTRLEYEQLLALLDLTFINPNGQSRIDHQDSSCDLDKKTITALDQAKLDRIQRFLRLWRKLSGWALWELDLVLRALAIGNGALDGATLVALFHFARLKERLGPKVTVEQVCGLFRLLNTAGHFVQAHEKRGASLYESIFLNKRLSHPLPAAFVLDPVTGDVGVGQSISANATAIQAALGISETDLAGLISLSAPNGTPYVSDALNVANLSFLWRHSWLRKQLRLKTDAWKTMLRIMRLDLAAFNGPAQAWAIMERIEEIKTSGLSLEEWTWVLEADTSSKAALSDVIAARSLTMVRATLKDDAKVPLEEMVVGAASEQWDVSPAHAHHLLTAFALPSGGNLLAHFTGAFALSEGVIDGTSQPVAFKGWRWGHRVATLWRKWKLSVDDIAQYDNIKVGTRLLATDTLPLDSGDTPASLDDALHACSLFKLRDALPETGITLLEVLEKTAAGSYAALADLAQDVVLLNEAWDANTVVSLWEAIGVAAPADALTVQAWDRSMKAFAHKERIGGGADVVVQLAAPTMTAAHVRAAGEALRAKFGAETWTSLSTEIQDALRDRKREALTSYLLTQPLPTDAPSSKWENTNDLYAYYLLDVEMCACMTTSRFVQGSGSIQLFVQRCFMGLEPEVLVQADGDEGDSAWKWWKWMRKYRLWEANLKVFLWPENWIEPELKKDRSSFFKDLEQGLLQGEIDQYAVEDAFKKYLDQLDGVSQLEVAGFYQEDNGDETLLHVFGRTHGAEPHLYYYRRYDFRQWTPWEKVDLDIQGDQLIPAVINRRLFLFWPVLTEEPQREENATMRMPKTSDLYYDTEKAKKKLRIQLASSELRKGQWTPKRISTAAATSAIAYDFDATVRQLTFEVIDHSDIDGRFVIAFDGRIATKESERPWFLMAGAFEVSGCKGLPEVTYRPGNYRNVQRPIAASVGLYPNNAKWEEQSWKRNDLTLGSEMSPALATVIEQTPWQFSITPGWHLSYMDRLWHAGLHALPSKMSIEMASPLGTWLPFFYRDKKRTFFVLPLIQQRDNDIDKPSADGPKHYYPELKGLFHQVEQQLVATLIAGIDQLDLSVLSVAQRTALENMLASRFTASEFPEDPRPPYTDDEFRSMMKRFFKCQVDLYVGMLSLKLFGFRKFHFKNFYHPFVCDLAKLVNDPLKGVPAMMRRETQFKDSGFDFLKIYQPNPWVITAGTNTYYPKEHIDFSPDGAFAPYNWELFYHAPLFIANALSKNQRFEEAREWYHYIFNPIGLESSIPGGSPMSKYWITKPFYETTDPQYVQQRIENMLRMLAGDATVPGYSTSARTALEGQVIDWRTNPFEPHRIANYRTVAYQKTVVMKYLDNLINWGDQLFRQDSMESINEATQLYILAAEILGPRPKRVPPQVKPPVETFNELERRADALSNALVEVENMVPALPGTGAASMDAAPIPMLYFCVPHNEKMLGYWDTVSDRLHKLRNCMNIEGVVRQLALFEPPIDPGAMVKGVANGAGYSSALAELGDVPLYRFNVLLQKANEVCNDVKALGWSLLSALEKKDAEAMGLLRQDQELRVLNAFLEMRRLQIDEAKENVNSLKKSKELAEIKRKYYATREFMSVGEAAAMQMGNASSMLQIAIQLGHTSAAALKAIPDLTAGVSGLGSAHVVTKTGGDSAGASAQEATSSLNALAVGLDKMAGLAGTLAAYGRRSDDWEHQRDLALKEIEQLDRAIAGAELRVRSAEADLASTELQIENARESDEFMRGKYTNLELYQWQIGQISNVYFQSYQLAFDLAKRAERCYRFELGVQDSSYITYGHWDSLKKGLMSGEKLQHDLRRLDNAYIEQNKREFELTKHVSLLLQDPLALVRLRETGRCFFNLPEEIFDLDYPGHYFRRIKSVSITLPCVTGPLTTISCTLRLTRNSLRINTTDGEDGYAHNVDDAGLPITDERFVESNIPVKSIAASSAQNDSGVFELNFRDERYLPFEGAGAISEWALELFTDGTDPDFGAPLRQFDYSTISDAVLHVKYTAREDAGDFKNKAVAQLRAYFAEADANPSVKALDLRRQFPNQWQRFQNPADPALGNVFELDLAPGHFALRDKGKKLKVNSITLLARCTDPGTYKAVLDPPLPTPPPAGANEMSLAILQEYGGLHAAVKDISALGIEVDPSVPPVTWKLRIIPPTSGPLGVEDLVLVLGYQWE